MKTYAQIPTGKSCHRLVLALLLLAAPVLASAQSAPNLAQMFANFSSSATELSKMLMGLSYLLGFIITGIGLFRLKEYSEAGGRIKFSQPMFIIFAGAMLFAAPGMIDTTTQTLSLGHSLEGQLLANPDVGSTSIPGLDQALQGVLLFVKLIGNIAFIRGLLMLKDIGEGKQGAGMGRALTHLIGGAMAINIGVTISMLAATVAPGMSLGGLGVPPA